MSTNPKTIALVDGLRALAAMIEAHPEAAEAAKVHWWLEKVNVPVGSKEVVAAMARAGLKAGAKVTKWQDSKHAGVDVKFGPVGLRVYLAREEICERVVVGTREVTEEVPDPDALAAIPKVTVTTTVEDVEWRCGSILADVAS